MTTSNQRHYVALDGLRGMAALVVLVFHAQQAIGAKLWLPASYLAVDFFFMLSGFIIAMAYEEK